MSPLALRERIAIALVAGALVIGLSPFRVFPFSDFPLYSYVLPSPSILTLIAIEKSGEQKVLSPLTIRPLTRIHLDQMLQTLVDNKRDPAPELQWITSRVRSINPNAVSIAIARIQLEPAPEAVTPYAVTATEILNVIPIN